MGPGLTLTLDRYEGAGMPVVLLHGIPGSRRAWRKVAAALAGHHTIVVPDLLGFGGSSDPAADFHAAAQATAILGLLDQLRISRAHVVGFDFGGAAALAAYGAAPERFASLALAATNAFTDTPVPPPLGAARIPVVGDLLFAAMCSWPGLAGLWLNAVGDKRALPWREFISELPERRGRRWTKRIFLDSLRHLQARYAPIQAILPTVDCPVSVVWGDRDPFFALSAGQRTAAAIPGATLHVLNGCGHFIPLERPAELAASILSLASTLQPVRTTRHPRTGRSA